MEQAQENNQQERKWGILIILAIPLFMMLLDVTIVNIAIPHIMTYFNVGITSVEWVLNIYVLIFAALLITLGKSGDLYGRKRLFLIGLAVFTVASLLCGLAPSFSLLLVARGIQAVGAAAMMPATLSILNVVFARSGRGLALGLWGAVAGTANALGPVIGGVLIDAYSWHWIFLINIPIGVIAFIVAAKVLGESRDLTASQRIDIPGVLTVSLALFSLTYALVEGESYGWTSATILSLFTVSLASFIAFFLIELRSSHPLIQLNLFRNISFTAGNVVGLIISFGLLGVIFLVALFLQLVLGFSATRAGLTLLPMPIVMMIVAPFAGRLSDRISGRWLLFPGMIISAYGIYLLSNLSVNTTGDSLLLPLAVCGLGMGLVLASTTTVVMASAPVEYSGGAAGILTTMRQVGAVLGISVLGAVLQTDLVAKIKVTLLQFPQLPQMLRDTIISAISQGSVYVGPSLSGIPIALKTQLIGIFNKQFAASLNSAMRVSIYLCLAGAIVALVIRKHNKKVS